MREGRPRQAPAARIENGRIAFNAALLRLIRSDRVDLECKGGELHITPKLRGEYRVQIFKYGAEARVCALAVVQQLNLPCSTKLAVVRKDFITLVLRPVPAIPSGVTEGRDSQAQSAQGGSA